MKRVFGTFEVVFNIIYLFSVLFIGIVLLLSARNNQPRMLAGIMALILAGGDAFHLVPRILLIRSKKEEELKGSLGLGKQITSISMTIFYVILWHIGVILNYPENFGNLSIYIYILAVMRIVLCLLPQNKWKDRCPPVSWGILRNLPFFLLGIWVAFLFFNSSNPLYGLAIILSFLFYLPVVLWANKYPKVGMLMLPKTCAYLWLLILCLSL